jgi:membrane protein implicated in regulation of membrane protease activity
MGAAVLIIMLMYVLLTKRNILSVMFIVVMGVVGALLAILMGWYLEYSQIILSVIISALLPWSVHYTYNNLLKNPS